MILFIEEKGMISFYFIVYNFELKLFMIVFDEDRFYEGGLCLLDVVEWFFFNYML